MRKFVWICLLWLPATLTAQTILLENFNNGIPGNWIVINGGTSTHTWFGTSNGLNNNFLDGTEFAFVNSDAAGNSVDTILSEQLRSPVFNGTSYPQVYLEFDQYYRQYSTDSGFVEVFDGNNWVVLASYSTDNGGWGNPDHPIFNLTPYRNSAMQVRFRYEDNAIWAWYWAIDNVYIYAPPPYDAEMTTLNPPTGTCGLGTTEQVSIGITNQGTQAISGMNVSYQINGGAIITEFIATTIAPGNTLSYTFATTANLSPAGIYEFAAWTGLPGDANNANDTLSSTTTVNHLTASGYPYVEDFENGAGGFFAHGTGSTWALGTPAKDIIQGAASGFNAWVTGGLGTTNYGNNENNFVESPCFDMSNLSNPWFGIDAWWNIEWSWDGAVLQATSDGGQNWQRIGAFGDPYNWYTDNTINANPGGQNNGWTGRDATGDGSGGYLRAVHNISSFAGQSEVIFRFAFATDGSVTDDGFAFDQFTIGEAPLLYLGPDTSVCDSMILDAGPATAYNWSTGDSTRTIVVYNSGTYIAEIFDSLGFPSLDQIHVTVNASAPKTLGEDSTFCHPQPWLLSASSGAQSVQWSTGATTNALVVSNTGTYSYAATYSGGCVARDTVSLEFLDIQADFNLPDDTVCMLDLLSFTDNSDDAATWWWDFGDGTFSSNSNPVHAYAVSGTYQVTLRVTNAHCSDQRAAFVYVDVCSGIDGQDAFVWTVYPNPTRQRVTVEFSLPYPVPMSWKVVDMRGKQIREGDLGMREGQIRESLDLGDVSAGFYGLRFCVGDAILFKKIQVLR